MARADEGGLARRLGLVDAICIGVGTMVGTSIFVLPGVVATHLPHPALVVAAWIGGALFVLLGALCLAELAAAMPEAGGEVVYIERAFGPVWGYLCGWSMAIVSNPCSIAAIAIAFATYLAAVIPLEPLGVAGTAMLSIAALTAINVAGVRAGALVQNAVTVLKVGAMVALAALVLGKGVGGSALAAPPPLEAPTVRGVVLALVAIVWAYDGWYEATYVGGEVRDPGRTLPRALLWALAITAALYVAANLGYLATLPLAVMQTSEQVASDAAGVALGAAGATVVAAVIALSAFGGNNGIILTVARVPYAMARRGLFASWAGVVHPRLGTPANALVAQGVWASVLVLAGAYDQLVTAIVFSQFIFHGLAAAAVIRLRRTEPALERPYRAWGYPVTPIAFIAVAAALVVLTLFEAPRESAVGLGLILVGLALYPVWRGRALRRAARPDPAAGA